jgi:Carbohydrate family 9 binding domain-like
LENEDARTLRQLQATPPASRNLIRFEFGKHDQTVVAARSKMKTRTSIGYLVGIIIGFGVLAGTSVSQDKSQFPCAEKDIPHYTAYRLKEPIKVDGVLDERGWRSAPRSSRFVDLISGQATLYDTRAALLWDDNQLYVGYWVEEPNVAATLTERDSPIYKNNDVELFIAGKDSYYEFEINAFNTIYEVFFIWEESYDQGGYAGVPEFSRSNPKVRPFNGVGFKTHPRGRRLGSWAWDFPGLQTAVHVNGTLNQSGDTDSGWTVELAFPWPGMKWLARADGRSLPPKNGDIWRMDFSRFNQYKAPAPAKDSGGWVWSRHGIWDSHIPECFTYIHFSTEDVTASRSKSKP